MTVRLKKKERASMILRQGATFENDCFTRLMCFKVYFLWCCYSKNIVCYDF